MTFKSKIDIWLGGVLLLVPIITFGAALTEPSLAAILVAVAITALIAYLVIATKYVIDGESLFIHGGIIKREIPVQKITGLRKTRNPLSAPALSIDRIEITYQPGMQIMLVSPAEKEFFIETLVKINGNIVVDENLIE